MDDDTQDTLKAALHRFRIGQASQKDKEIIRLAEAAGEIQIFQTGGVHFGVGNTIQIQGSVIGTLSINLETQEQVTWLMELLKPKPPLELPERPLHFKDRQDELIKLLSDLKPGVVVTLCGPGGIGKTSLAAETLWQLTGGTNPPKDFPDGVLFHSFYNQPQAELAFEHIARSFGEEPRPTAALAAQRALAGKTALLLLDGAEAADNLESVLALRGRGCALVTSRDRGDIVEDFQDLDPLGKADGAALLQDWGGKRVADREAAGLISELVGGLPMAIRLAGQYMQANEMEARDYLDWLKKTPLAALDQGKRKMESVSVLLDRSLAAVSREAITALGAVGLLALAPFERRAVAEALEVNEEEAGRRLGELARYGMLRRLNGEYQVTHSLVHTYSRTVVKPPEGSLARLGGYFDRFAHIEQEKGTAGYTRLDSARVHILAVLQGLAEKESWEACKAMAWAIEDYLDIQGYWVEYLQVCQIAVKAAQVLQDRWEEGAWLNKLGLAYDALGEPRRAIETHEQGLAIAREMDNRYSEGVHLGNMGKVYRNLGEARLSIDYSDKALVIAREIGDWLNEGTWLANLGNAYKDLGETQRAIDYYQQALDIVRKIGDKRNEGSWLGYLGNAYSALGKTKRAIEYHEQALDIAREIGDRNGESNQLGNLGNAYSALGETQKAIEYYEQALAIAREIGDKRNEGTWLGNLGNSYAALGETKRVIEYHEQALAIQKEIDDRRGEGNALGNLGLAYADLGETRRAIEYYEQGLAIAREISDRRGEGADLGYLGLAYASLGETQRAIEYHQQALDIAREIGDRRREGAHLGNLGNAYKDLGETQRAIECYEQALTIARETGDRRSEGGVLGNMGNTYGSLGQMEKAIDNFRQALAITKEIGDKRSEGMWLGNLGNSYLNLKQVRRAIDFYEQALFIARKIGDRRNEGMWLGNLGNSYAALGDKEQARKCWEEALEIFRQIESPYANRVRGWLEKLD